jgi:hypothetical protein
MSWDDFKTAYKAGGDAYREKSSHWSSWVPAILVVVFTTTVSRYVDLAWYFSMFVFVVAFALLTGIIALAGCGKTADVYQGTPSGVP